MKRTAWWVAGIMVLVVLARDASGGDKKGTEVGLDGLKSVTPADWKAFFDFAERHFKQKQ